MQHKFMALRVVASIFKVLAWVILVIGVLSACVTVAAGAMPGLLGAGGGGGSSVSSTFGAFGLIGGLIGAVAIVLVTLLYFLFVFAFGDIVNLMISLEENTRLTAERLAGQAPETLSAQPKT